MMRWILLFLLLTTSAAATPLISGVLYNPAGADTDKEWIELHNPSNETIDTFCSLWFGNGASAADWTLQWEGNISFFPSGYVTIGESGVTPDPDMIVGLNLQNGPDALRLECAEGGDLVGWGGSYLPRILRGISCIPDGRWLCSEPEVHRRRWHQLCPGHAEQQL